MKKKNDQNKKPKVQELFFYFVLSFSSLRTSFKLIQAQKREREKAE